MPLQTYAVLTRYYIFSSFPGSGVRPTRFVVNGVLRSEEYDFYCRVTRSPTGGLAHELLAIPNRRLELILGASSLVTARTP